MDPGRKTHSTILILTLLAFTMIAVSFIEATSEESITGSFTEANEPEKITIEEVYWEFGENRTAYGNIVEQNFTEGRHNVTLVVEKSNGEVERHHGEALIE